MIDNPFLSETFTKKWAKSFGKEETPTDVEGVYGPKFYRGKWGILTNYGKTHTKGMQYTLERPLSLKKEILLIFDVPTYFKIPQPQDLNPTKLIRVKQYPGFLIELDSFSSLQEYLQKKFKKSSRYKLNKYSRRLSECFDIKTQMYLGDAITEEAYNFLFDRFRELLEKRFLDKAEHNNNLDEKEWDFYKSVAYPLILKKQAGLFVVKNGENPIAITLVYFSKDVIFDAITVFDIDYAKFHLGSVNIMHLIDWGIANKFKLLDFSKGYFDYKTRWATKSYDFEYHILYNSKSFSSVAKAMLAKNYFKLKQYIREKDLNLLLNKVLFRFRKKEWDSTNASDEKGKSIVFEDVEVQDTSLVKIDAYSPQVIKLFFDFLYLNNESAKDVEVFYGSNGQYLFRGKNSEKVAHFT